MRHTAPAFPTARQAAALGLALWATGGAILAVQDQPVVAEVTQVLEGDLLQMSWEGERHTVRLYGVDAPESGQRFFSRSKELVIQLAAGHNVQLQILGVDSEGNFLARVDLADGRELNQVLVRNGLAWWRQGVDAPDLERLEKRAREEERGLWSQPFPRPPWEFRQAASAGEDDLVQLVEIGDSAGPTPTDVFWEETRRRREQASRQEAARIERLAVWYDEFQVSIQPVQAALDQMSRALAEYRGLWEACRDVNLQVIALKKDKSMINPPDPRVNSAVDRMLGSYTHMVRACQEGKDRDMGEYWSIARGAVKDLYQALALYSIGPASAEAAANLD